MARLTVLATETDAGKTFLVAALLRGLRGRGCVVRPYKPFASGTFSASDDTSLLRAACGEPLTEAQVTPWRFERPVAPAFILRDRGIRLSAADLLTPAAALERGADLLITETAGGLLSPLTERWSSLDAADLLGGPLLLVVRNRLGAISAAENALRLLDLPRRRLVAVVLSDGAEIATEEDALLLDENEDWLRRANPALRWFRLRRGGAPDEALLDLLWRRPAGR